MRQCELYSLARCIRYGIYGIRGTSATDLSPHSHSSRDAEFAILPRPILADCMTLMAYWRLTEVRYFRAVHKYHLPHHLMPQVSKLATNKTRLHQFARSLLYNATAGDALW